MPSDIADGLARALLHPAGELPTYWGRLLAGSMPATIPIAMLFFLLQKYYVQRMTSTGAKG